MKKFIILSLSVFSIIFLFGCGLRDESESGIQKEPDPRDIAFQELTTAQVKRVYIVAYNGCLGGNPQKLAELTYDDMDSLTALLNQVELTGEPSDSFTDITGMYWEMYRIELENGQEFDFAAHPEFYVIDLKGFEANKELGTEIFRQYHDWNRKYFPEDYSDD